MIDMRNKTIFVWLALALLALVSPAAAGISDGNFTAPEIDYDLRSGTYTQYWLDFSNGFPAYGLIYAICLPFISIFGYWFFAMLWFLYLGLSYMRTGDVTLPLTVGLISGAVWGAIMPPETFIVGYVMLATSIVAILMKLYLRDRL